MHFFIDIFHAGAYHAVDFLLIDNMSNTIFIIRSQKALHYDISRKEHHSFNFLPV